MKVLIGSHGYPSTKYPMNAVHEMVYAKTLKKHGIDVYVVGLDMRSIRRKRKMGLEKLEMDGIPVYTLNLPVGAVDPRLMGKISTWGLRKILPKIYREEGLPDIIHSHFSDTSYAFAKVNRKKLPLVITEHSSLLNKEKKEDISKGLFEISAYAFEDCDKLIIGSPYYKERIEKNFNVRTEYIPILTPTDDFEIKKKKTSFFKIVSTGNLKEAKGHRDVIQAFDRAFEKGQARLFIFGEGPDRPVLEKMITDRGLQDIVFLMGQKTTREIAQEYGDADLFVLASHSETFGKAIIEAMKSGLPVLTTKNGGSNHFIQGFNGKLTEVGNINGLAQEMRWMKDHIENYNKEKISSFVEDQYSEEQVISQVIDVYNEVLGADHVR